MAGLGARRLAALAAAGAAVFVLVGVSSYFMTRLPHEVLYAGLELSDASAIGSALGEAGIAFDVNEAGDTVLVGRGQAPKARMYLAQKGLPRGGSSGYELFDKLGSMGLTSFMQQVTKVRALEGELARSIQLIDGIKAARVHVSLGSEPGFRGSREMASASVIVRGEPGSIERSARAIRHLVAAAIPGLPAARVAIMGTDGLLLPSQAEGAEAAPEWLMALERQVAADIERNILRSLTPQLGPGNLRVSVSVKLNADQRKISETKFDPESRVERSVRTFKESGEAENANGAEGVSVDQNIPQEESATASGDSSRERKDRKEELTNYEINSKSMETVSDGYSVERLSVAVVVNRQQIVKLLGEGASAEASAAEIAAIERIVRSAAGIDAGRGDQLEVSPVDFTALEAELPAEESGGVASFLEGHLGSMINVIGLIAVTLLVLLLGLRPAVRQLLAAEAKHQPGFPAAGDAGLGALPMGFPTMGALPGSGGPPAFADPRFDELEREVTNSPRDRLIKIVELDPDRAAEVLRQWLNEPAEGRP